MIVLVVACALIDVDERVLLVRRPVGKSMAGLWEFPGGKIDDGESPETALARELAEELALNVSTTCLKPLSFVSYDYDSWHLLMPFYTCRIWSGIPQPCEGQQLAWLKPFEISTRDMPPADKPLVEALCLLLQG